MGRPEVLQMGRPEVLQMVTIAIFWWLEELPQVCSGCYLHPYPGGWELEMPFVQNIRDS